MGIDGIGGEWKSNHPVLFFCLLRNAVGRGWAIVQRVKMAMALTQRSGADEAQLLV